MGKLVAPKWLTVLLFVAAAAVVAVEKGGALPANLMPWASTGALFLAGVGALFGLPLFGQIVAPAPDQPQPEAKPAPTPPPPPPPLPPAALLLVGLGLALSSCACWQPQSPDYNSAKCVVARGTVACGEQVAGAILAGVLGQLPQPTADGILSTLEGQAAPAAGCLLASVAGALLGPTADKPTLSAPSPLYQDASARLAAWRAKNAPGAKLCFSDGACR